MDRKTRQHMAGDTRENLLILQRLATWLHQSNQDQGLKDDEELNTLLNSIDKQLSKKGDKGK